MHNQLKYKPKIPESVEDFSDGYEYGNSFIFLHSTLWSDFCHSPKLVWSWVFVCERKLLSYSNQIEGDELFQTVR